MQTFLPYPSFLASARVLDSPRLGKQRVETLQILRALELPEYGWRNHPAVRMWRGRTPALVVYGLTCVGVWTDRGFGDSTAAQILEFAPEAAGRAQEDLAIAGMLPSWVGDERLHRSHRSKLVAKDPDLYAPVFGDVPTDLEYFWPEPDEVLAAPAVEPGRPLWVLRPESEAALGRFLAKGVVGLGETTGVEEDVAGRSLAELKDLLGLKRRPPRPLIALAALVAEVSVGDEVALLVDRERALLLGRVTGDYEYVGSDTAGACHRRSVAWDRVVPRASVTPPSALQDVRPLFPVRLAMEVHDDVGSSAVRVSGRGAADG